MHKSYIDSNDLSSIELLDKEDLINIIQKMMTGGVSLNFYGKRTVQEIDKKVRPRVTRVIKNLCVGEPTEQAKNLLIEGENLQAMVTLYKYRGQVDLIVTDPPYNTGQQFRYNDNWEQDPNDPDLGTLVAFEDGSRHTKWMKAMLPRLHMMKRMLKPNGVMAICIDHNELYHLGMLMDEVFGENNRIAIINWQKTYSPKSDSEHVSISTEYVLVYAKDKKGVKTGLLKRTAAMDRRYANPDKDPYPWGSADLTGGRHKKPEDYGIMSPFTGEIYYPLHRWRLAKKEIHEQLKAWGSQYVSMKDPQCTLPSLVLKGTVLKENRLQAPESIIASACSKAMDIRDNGIWPKVFFLKNGLGSPRYKRYLKDVKQGKVPMTYWADEDYDEPIVLGSQSWNHTESGHSQAGIKELDALLGRGHGFDTVKPLKLIKKIIQLWCPPNGLVLDPYAGSGTTGHAVLELNFEAEAKRRFILIEQGSPEKGDKYARSLTQVRLRRAITGERVDAQGNQGVSAVPLGGGFEFRMLVNQIDARVVLSMKKDELVDVVITSHWEDGRRNSPELLRVDERGYKYLVGKDERGEGYFIIWDGEGPVGQLDASSYAVVLQEANKAGVQQPYNVYARYELYQSRSVNFYKIPDRILDHLGLNENTDAFNQEEVDSE